MITILLFLCAQADVTAAVPANNSTPRISALQQSHLINKLLNAFAALGSVALFAGSYQIFAVTPATACDWYNMISTKRPIGKPPATINALILKSLK